MKIPFSWLKDYVDIDCSAEELEAKLFSCGFEVEETLYFGEKIDKIVTCRILKIEKHPNADKLSVCTVDAGKYGTLQIITAATNVFEGATVPVALDGSTLFNGEKIRKGKLRGLESCGMFCSGEELGITDDWYEGASVHGILIFREDLPLGESVKDILGIDDVIFDVNVTANRPDCQSVLGMAREVAAVLGKPLKMPDLSYNTDAGVSTFKTVKITDDAFDLCPRYKGRLIKDVKIGPSPEWMRRRLFSMGLKSINNVVDITNFVLLEIGQPMHAFDLRDLEGNEINVRRAKKGEKIITLDEKEFKLDENNLVICDAEKPVALAGVMGGLNSGIKDDTKDVLFESARFARDNIRKTSRTLGQRSDSSARFEKGVDYLSQEIGLKRALNLVDKLGCGKIACDEYDLKGDQFKEKTIETTVDKINGVLGLDIAADTVKNILERLDFKVTLDGRNITVTVPLYREDVEGYPDLAEEVIREYGYDNITPTLLKTSAITAGGRNAEQKSAEDLKDLLIGYGYNETITNSFVSEKEFDLFGLDKSRLIRILNPISEDMAVMRTTLIPSLVRAAVYNINRQNHDGKLFELAKTYFTVSGGNAELPEEREVLCFVAFGEREDYFSVKGVADGIFAAFCYGKEIKYVRSSEKFMHPTRSADIFVDGEKVGLIGQVHPDIVAACGADKAVFVGEIRADTLKKYFNGKITAKQVSKFPSVERDLAVITEEDVLCDDVVSVIKRNGGKILEKVSLFDVYRGNQVATGKKSMAFNLVFGSDERTLNVKEVDDAIEKILKHLKSEVNAELR